MGPSILSLKHYLLKDSGRRGITTLSCICICGAHELRQIALNSAMQMVLVYLLMTQTPVPIILPATLPMFLQYLAESSIIINKYPINLYYATVIPSFKYFLNLTSYSISIYTLLTMVFLNITYEGGEKNHYSKNIAFAILVN